MKLHMYNPWWVVHIHTATESYGDDNSNSEVRVIVPLIPTRTPEHHSAASKRIYTSGSYPAQPEIDVLREKALNAPKPGQDKDVKSQRVIPRKLRDIARKFLACLRARGWSNSSDS